MSRNNDKKRMKMWNANYMEKVFAKMSAGEIPSAAGSASIVNILHDDWCAKLTKNGECNCDPEVQLGAVL